MFVKYVSYMSYNYISIYMFGGRAKYIYIYIYNVIYIIIYICSAAEAQAGSSEKPEVTNVSRIGAPGGVKRHILRASEPPGGPNL